MKVAYLLGSLNRGGTETLLLDVFKSAHMAEFEFIGIHRKDGPLKDEFYATTPLFIKCGLSKWNFISYPRRLRNILKENGISIVHANQTIDAVLVHLACIGTNIKVVRTFHGYDFHSAKIMEQLIKKSFKWCDSICFVSQHEQKYYLDKYGQKYADKCHVVYNGVNFDKLTKRLPKIVTSKENNKKQRLKLGTVGNFVPGRDQFTLCKFLNLLNKQGVDFDFYFVGKKSDAEPWRYDDCVTYCQQNGFGDKIHFMGTRSDVPLLLTQWDAFLYSTEHDTFGIAVVEAIASGVPTFVNDWDVMREITDNGRLANLYKTKDTEDLLRAFNVYLQTKGQYEQDALKNAKIIRTKFCIRKHLEDLKDVYAEIGIGFSAYMGHKTKCKIEIYRE